MKGWHVQVIKTIIFDFDGVLVESTNIKTDAFRRLFSKWADHVDEIVDYHKDNMGLSRYVKFEHFYKNILNEPYSEESGEDLSRRFSEIVVEEIEKAPFVAGAKEFLEANCGDLTFFIASGTPESELKDIVSHKGLAKYFKGVYGSPSTKTEITEMLLKEHSLNIEEVVFIGDTRSDKVAADNTGVGFILRITADNAAIESDYKVRDMTSLERTIKEMTL